jgi:hypothetical protein
MQNVKVTELSEEHQAQAVEFVMLLQHFIQTNPKILSMEVVPVLIGLDLLLQHMIKEYEERGSAILN